MTSAAIPKTGIRCVPSTEPLISKQTPVDHPPHEWNICTVGRYVLTVGYVAHAAESVCRYADGCRQFNKGLPGTPHGLCPPNNFDRKYRNVRTNFMMYVTTIDVEGITPEEYRAVLDKMGVETHPDAHIYLHISAPIEGGFRIIEIWDNKEAFEEFLKNRLTPANESLGIERSANITIKPLHNFFAPRLTELPGVIRSLPGAPGVHAA